MKKRRLEKKLMLSRETLRHLMGGQKLEAGLTTTPIGTCPESDPAVCCSGGGPETTLPCTQ
jgi:hypothetical protein